ncbi:MAG: flavin reductase (DIM6/NTAB) family NADH-FMN oxidoreductase RutF [Saprospiraceae bacterium]|jgi:flavin reductase (DIM6/NTAB) family NADH-FMN oxidoreductase RutF
MKYTKHDIAKLDRISRLKIINSVTGIKPANLVGTVNEKGQANLAIFSSVIHLGSNPALLGFISRPLTADVGHTFHNIQANGSYTINHIHPGFIENAHYTSAKFDEDVSEFERCNLTEEYIDDFQTPFVAESQFKMGMRFIEAINIKLNGTVMVIGEIEHLIIPDAAMIDGDIDLEASNGVGISGLNSYYGLKRLDSFPYARVDEVPEFKL